MPAALSRRALAALGVGTFALSFAAVARYETPNAGIGRFFYIAIAFVALASGPFSAGGAGMLASGLYALGVVINPHVPASDLLTLGSLLRDVTYVALGFLVGWFAATTRQLMEQLRILAERDPVTGIGNLRSFEAMITRHLEVGELFALLVGDCGAVEAGGDLDGSAVDSLMSAVSNRLVREVGQPGEIARTGQSEFAVLVSGAATSDPAAMADRLEHLARLSGCRATFGWAVHPEDGTNALALYRAAMERLYLRKVLTAGAPVKRSRAPLRGSLYKSRAKGVGGAEGSSPLPYGRWLVR